MSIGYVILSVAFVALLISSIFNYQLVKKIEKLNNGFGLLIDKFFDQSNTNMRLLDRTINNASDNINSVLRNAQRIKRTRD